MNFNGLSWDYIQGQEWEEDWYGVVATKLLDKACQKLRGIPDVPSQRITDLEAAIRQMRRLSCILERDAVVRPLCSKANLFCGCFCLGSAPFVCLVCCSSWRNANLAGGFAGRPPNLCSFWFIVICLHFRTF